MNLTNFSHVFLALLCQLAIASVLWIFGVDFSIGSTMGGLLAIGFYLGREVTQAEIKAGGSTWWIGFDIRKWSQDSIYDLVFPAVACTIVVLLSVLL